MAIMWNSAILEELHHTAALDKDRTAWKYIWVSQGFPSQRHNSNYFRQGRERAGILLSLKDCYQKSMSPFLLPHASFVHKLKLQLLEASGLQQHAQVKESSSPSILMWKIPEKHSDWARPGATSTMWLWGQCVMLESSTALWIWDSGADSRTFWLKGRQGSFSKRSGDTGMPGQEHCGSCYKNQGGGSPY